MDFLDPDKKRAHKRRLFIGYALVGIAIIIGSIILLFQTYGYDVDRKTGNIIQNGLLFVSARPVSAQIYLDGAQKDKTDARYTLPAGQYSVELTSSGYHSWKRTITLDGGSIERLIYPVLFPLKLTPQDVKLYAAQPALSTESPDRHWLIVQQPGSSTAFDMYDLTKPGSDPAALSLPAAILTQPAGAQSYGAPEWSSDNRHLLLKHAFKGGSEYIMLDRQTPAASFNINKTLNTALPSVSLRDKKYDQYYIYNNSSKALETASLSSKTPKLILQNVLAFKAHGSDTLLYVSALAKTAGKAALRLYNKSEDIQLAALPASPSYLLDITQYSGHWYAAAGGSSEGRAAIYKDPQDYNPASGQPYIPVSVLKLSHAQFVSFSPNAEFIAIQAGGSFGVYDIQYDRRYYYTIKTPFPPDMQAVWMDGYHLAGQSKNTTQVWDFDGTNQQGLSSITPGTVPFFSSDSQSLFAIAPSVTVPKRTAVTYTSLKAQ